MPAHAAGSNDANLSGLSLSSGFLSPAFNASTTSYTARVAGGVSSITVTPTRAEANATITVNGVAVTSGSPSGSIALNLGNNTITTVVTAEDGTTIKTYTVNVIRGSGGTSLVAVGISSGSISFGSGNTLIATVTSGVSTITLSPSIDPNATVTVNGVAVTNGSPSGNITLNGSGTTTASIVVTAEDTITTSTYTVTINSLSNNADLSALTLSVGALSPTFASGTTSYTASVTNNISSITVTPTRAQANATIMVNGVAVTSGTASGAISLNHGSNTITTVVTAQDGTTTKTYTVTVTRSPADASNLSALTLSSGTLSPAFSSGTFSYTASVASNVTSITVTPTGLYGGSFISVNGILVTSGSPSGAIALNVGSNTITINSQSADASPARAYTIIVNRISNNAGLSALSASAGALSPTFATGTLSYTVNGNYGVTTTTVTATPSDSGATFTINGVAASSGVASASITIPDSGSLSIPILVTAADTTTTQTYTLNINRTVRPDPATDATVKAQISAQANFANQSTQAQINNISDRLQRLHDKFDPAASGNGQLAFAMPASQTRAAMYQLQDADPASPDPSKRTSLGSLMLSPEDTGLSQIFANNDFGYWVGGTIGSGSFGKGANNYDFNTAGVSMGIDALLSKNLIAGVALGYGNQDASSDSFGSGSTSNATSLTLYSSYKPEETFFVDMSLGYSTLSFDNQRYQAADAVLLKGDRDGTSLFGSVAVSRDITDGNLRFSPFLRTSLVHSTLDSYSETGSSALALTYDDMSFTNAAFSGGITMQYDYALSAGHLVPLGRLQFTRNSNDSENQNVYYTDLGIGSAANVNVNTASSNVGMAELGLSYIAADGSQVAVGTTLSAGSNDYMSSLFRLSYTSNF